MILNAIEGLIEVRLHMNKFFAGTGELVRQNPQPNPKGRTAKGF